MENYRKYFYSFSQIIFTGKKRKEIPQHDLGWTSRSVSRLNWLFVGGKVSPTTISLSHCVKITDNTIIIIPPFLHQPVPDQAITQTAASSYRGSGLLTSTPNCGHMRVISRIFRHWAHTIAIALQKLSSWCCSLHWLQSTVVTLAGPHGPHSTEWPLAGLLLIPEYLIDCSPRQHYHSTGNEWIVVADGSPDDQSQWVEWFEIKCDWIRLWWYYNWRLALTATRGWSDWDRSAGPPTSTHTVPGPHHYISTTTHHHPLLHLTASLPDTLLAPAPAPGPSWPPLSSLTISWWLVSAAWTSKLDYRLDSPPLPAHTGQGRLHSHHHQHQHQDPVTGVSQSNKTGSKRILFLFFGNF